MNSTETLVVVHLSATAVYTVIGSIVSRDDIRILGLSEVKISDFFYQGYIRNQEALKRSIKQSIQEAEDMANCRVHSVWLSFSTPELLSKNSYGKVYIEDDRVSVKDIVNALGQTKQRDMPRDHYLMQHVQQGVYINDNSSLLIEDPIGTFAHEITVMYHLMMLPVTSRQNMEELFRPANVRVDHMIFDAVSSAEYSLMTEEREQGVCFIDIGYNTTSICVYKEHKLLFTKCITNGANNVTMDISAELGLTMLEAEVLKKEQGTADSSKVDMGSFYTLKRRESDDELTINLHELALIIEARYVDIYNEVFSLLQEVNLVEHINSGVVLAGGGSKMKGLIAMSKRYLGMSVVLTNKNQAIKPSEVNDKKRYDKQHVKTVKRMIDDSKFYTAFGTLIYSQSDQFRHSERSFEEALIHSQKNSFLKRLNKFLKEAL
ncbi:MAG: cell division protein FtsA [Moraxellaceae bacterium]|nr:cell division protein FtsA [Moraxellaceae bacterium]